MVKVGRLLLRQCRLRAEITNVKRPLDVVFDTGPGQGNEREETSRTPKTQEMAAGVAVNEILVGLGIIPISKLQRLQLIPGEVFLGALPYRGGLGHMSVAIEGRELLGHRRKFLDRHT